MTRQRIFAADYADFADLDNWSPAFMGLASFRVIRGQVPHLTTCS